MRRASMWLAAFSSDNSCMWQHARSIQTIWEAREVLFHCLLMLCKTGPLSCIMHWRLFAGDRLQISVTGTEQSLVFTSFALKALELDSALALLEHLTSSQ